MIIKKNFLALLAFVCGNCCFTAALQGEESQILFQAYKGNVSLALMRYREYKQRSGSDDYGLLQKLAATIIEEQWHSSEFDSKLLALFGAGISLSEEGKKVLQEALISSYPELQLVALHFLAAFADDDAEYAILKSVNSEFLPIRLEACAILAERQNPRATAQIDMLYQRFPKELHFVFPLLYMLSRDAAALRAMRRLTGHPIPLVRLETIHLLAENNRDDFLPILRSKIHQPDIAEKEACSWALGNLHDSTSLTALQKLMQSPNPNVATAAAIASYRLGDAKAKELLSSYAMQEDLFAIHALGEIGEGHGLLKKLVLHQESQVRLNAAIALLQQREKSVVPKILDFCALEEKGQLLIEWESAGKTLRCYKLAPLSIDAREEAAQKERSFAIKEQLLKQIALLPEEALLWTAEEVFRRNMTDLIPPLTELLVQNPSPASIALLEKYQNQPGNPLLRSWCSLALYKINSNNKIAAEALKNWLRQNNQKEILSFHPISDFMQRGRRKEEEHRSMHYQLTAKEKCRLFIEILEAFAKARDEAAVEILVETMQNGPKENRAVLAGLLYHCLQ
jgi:HEAT repeat protein